MANHHDDLDDAVLCAGSLYAYLQRYSPDLALLRHPDYSTMNQTPSLLSTQQQIMHGTTILALRYNDGVVIGSDTQVTAGNTITGYMNKVLDISSHCAIAISGTVGVAQELSDRLRIEVTFYERINHAKLSPQGTANTLGRMIKANFAAIQHGLVCIPILATYDFRSHQGKVFSYDLIGTLFDTDYQTGGSGGQRALSIIEEKWGPDLHKDDAVSLAVESLVHASRTDTATTAVDEENNIYPIMKTIDREGIANVPDNVLKEIYKSIKKNSPRKRKIQTRGA
ncbi:hypothetical protein HY772_08245 [Candidatus Woesearchaeota archaeon]|nr:hypothetical protein [Candidatus Woesearchaeota archaeon]